MVNYEIRAKHIFAYTLTRKYSRLYWLDGMRSPYLIIFQRMERKTSIGCGCPSARSCNLKWNNPYDRVTKNVNVMLNPKN